MTYYDCEYISGNQMYRTKVAPAALTEWINLLNEDGDTLVSARLIIPIT